MGDLAELNRLCFDQMMRYLWWGDFERGIAAASGAFEVAARLGVPPVQYATIKAGCLMMLGRYGEAWRGSRPRSPTRRTRSDGRSASLARGLLL